MGTWQDIITISADLEEASAGAGAASAAFYPEPGEGWVIEVKRKDGGPNNEPWRAALEQSLDGTNWETSPAMRDQRRKYNQLIVMFPLRGPIYCCRVKIQNDDPSPDDKVKVDVRARRDAVVI